MTAIKTNKLNEPIAFLRHLQQHFPDAVIAGGAIRDTYFDILPRDYDIYIQDPGFKSGRREPKRYTCKHLAKICDLHLYDNRPHGYYPTDDAITTAFRNDYQYGGCNFVTQIYDVVKNLVPYQLIFVEYPPIEYLNKYFDFGICKAYCDGHRLRYTKDFMYDAKNKKLTLVGEVTSQFQYDWLMEHHLPKLKSKFPSHTVQHAEHNKKYIIDDSIIPF